MIKFLVAADFSPISFGGWHLLNAHLQKVTDLPIHMVVAESRSEQKDGLFHQKNPLVYADPMDAVQLVREQGYLPVARLRGESDEVLLVGAAEGAYQGAGDMKAACKILSADSVHLRQAGLRLLPDLSQADVEWVNVETFQETARRLTNQEADAAVLLNSTFALLLPGTRNRLKILAQSQMGGLHHAVLLHPDYAEKQPAFTEAFAKLDESPEGKRILMDLELAGFDALSVEEMTAMAGRLATEQAAEESTAAVETRTETEAEQ